MTNKNNYVMLGILKNTSFILSEYTQAKMFNAYYHWSISVKYIGDLMSSEQDKSPSYQVKQKWKTPLHILLSNFIE